MPALFSKVVFATLFSILLAAAAVFASGLHLTREEALISKEVSETINSHKNSWTASEKQGLLTGATRAEIKRRLGVKRDREIKLARKTWPKKSLSELPARWEAAEQWPSCPTITQIRDQAACGSCYCVSSSSAMSDRYCTYGIAQNRTISCSMALSCCWMCGQGCQGGQPEAIFQYAQYNGVTTSECDPYPFPKCAHHVSEPGVPPCSGDQNAPACSSELQYGCTNNQTSMKQVKYYFEDAYSVAGETDYMQELMAHGPFAVAFSVYADFPLYKGGVYKQTSNDYLGGHAVRIVGWGELNGEKYWKIANSWNAGWGLDGYFLIARGVDECGIEESGAAGTPSKRTS